MHLAFIKHSNYLSAINSIKNKLHNDIFHFLRTLPLFQKWTKTILKRFQTCISVKDYIRNGIVYKIGDESEKIYIVKSGEFQESFKVMVKDKVNNDDCYPLLLKENKLEDFRSIIFARKIINRSVLLKPVNVIYTYDLGSFIISRRHVRYGRLFS